MNFPALPSSLRRFVASLALLPLVFAAGVVQAQAGDALPPRATAALAAAVDGAHRSPAYRARDGARHPLETLAFFGIRPDSTVIEIAPGGGWYTEILAPYLHDHGRLYAAHEPADGSPGQQRARTAFRDKLARDPKVYGRVVLGTMPTSAFTDIRPPGGADAVLTFRNIHNWIEDGHFDESLRAFYDVLKPGGVLGVEEHRAPAGTSLARVIASGYVPQELVIERAKAAGFVFAGSSEVNANPRDTKDHANGVWSLPPTLRGGEVDRAKYQAIGESDRMTLKFVKPLRPSR
ncbi:methyltransferase domain-containing protein [Variovorax sp. RKNM96]|uniref:class I SAM-dependent methyltransferase n=1 Tax=Variovorax sp. RKNM96 TaxID=2681552 RepID=UPI00197DA214|nr:class I SAM-dependent methyltransferase [Variovorax sp. RKNM96]QSI31830.1 methyltransferase domain-containing protein [Variovorax sp. RKNM96]